MIVFDRAGAARHGRALAGVRRARLRARCWRAAPGTRPRARRHAPDRRRAARAAPSRCATCWSATCCRCAGTTSTPTRRAPRCSSGWRSRARRRRCWCTPRNVMRNPSAAQVARSLGLRAEVDGERFDLVVLGAGPAGLAAAVYGGSEGLRTFVAEAWAPGGQAGTSTRIENYLGFPSGISGDGADPQGDAAGAPLRRRPLELPPRGRADRRPRGPRARRPRRRPARARPLGRDGDRRPLARAGGRGHRPLPRRRRLPRGDGDRRRALPRRGRDRGRRRQLGRPGGGPPRRASPAACASSSAARPSSRRCRTTSSTASSAPRTSRCMTETEVTAVHGTRDRRVTSPCATAATAARQDADCTAVFVMIGADPCTEAAAGLLATRRRRLPALRRRRGGVRRAPRWPLGDREPHLLETVRPGRVRRRATCARARRSAWRERWATARWSCGSRTTCWLGDSSAQEEARLLLSLIRTNRPHAYHDLPCSSPPGQRVPLLLH